VFFGRVRERSVHQRSALPGEMARSFVVTVTLDENGASARVDFVDADGTAITRGVRGETCDEVVSGIALVTALAIDARAGSESAVPAPAASVEAPPPKAKPPPPKPPPKPAPGSPPLLFTAGLGVGWTSYAGPAGALSFDAFFAASLGERGPLARLSAFHLRADIEEAGVSKEGETREGRLRTYGGKLEGCPLSLRFAPLFLEPCLGTNLGVLVSSGVESSELRAAHETQVWWDAVLIGRLGVVIDGWVVIEAQGEFGVPLSTPSFGFGEDEGQAVFAVPKVGASARGGVGIRFP